MGPVDAATRATASVVPHGGAADEAGRAGQAVGVGPRVPIPGHPYRAFLTSLERPARYVGGEVGAVRKDWTAARARVCLAFPDLYEIGMSHLGFRILYDVLNGDPRTLAERCYCPWLDLERELRARRLPLVSLESYRPLAQFDVVGFSLQFELNYTNVLTMLDLGGIPLGAAARGEADPLVVAGGPTAFHPEPMADFFDAIVVGDGERKLTEVALVWTAERERGRSRAERLRALAALGSVYVPSLHATRADPLHPLEVVCPPDTPEAEWPIRRARVDLGDFPFPPGGPTGGPETVFDRTSLEIARGCHEGCRFCQAGMIYRPMRERSAREIVATALAAVRHTGHDVVSLTALSPADVSFVRPLLGTVAGLLATEGVGLGISSLRAYGLGADLLEQLRHLRAAGLTFAPEAGTQRLRDAINKNVSDAELRRTAAEVFARGWTRVKLYFMVGLPTETDEDVQGIVTTARDTAAIGRQAARRRVEITVSVSNHVPKPHTPFQWEAMATLAELVHRQELLRRAVRSERSVKLRLHDAWASRLEGVLARGDRRLGRAIERAWRAGARFDSWQEQLRRDCWTEALAAEGLRAEQYLGELPTDAVLPWSHIDVGVHRAFLERERRRALRGRPTPPCSRPAETPSARAPTLVCHHCGADCDLEAIQRDRRQQVAALAALGPPSAAAADLARAAPRPAGPARIGSADPGHRYRFRFRKLGAAALLGHLDLVRELPRVLRRIGEGMVHTAGFHPKPVMAFSPALALGVASLDEYVDLRLVAAHPGGHAATLLRRMNAVSPRGLEFLSVVLLPDGAPPVTKLVAAARYWVLLDEEAVGLALGQSGVVATAGSDRLEAGARWLAERCRALCARDRLVQRRGGPGRSREVDLRPFLLAARPLADDAAGSFGDLGFAASSIGASLDVAITPTGSAKPGELATALLGEAEVPYGLVRAALFAGAAGALRPLASLLEP